MSARVRILTVACMVGLLATAVSACGDESLAACGEAECLGGACPECDGDPGGLGTEQASLKMRNFTTQPIDYVFSRLCGSRGWGEDQLGGLVIPSDEDISLHAQPGCADILVVLHSGERRIWSAVALEPGRTVTWSLRD